jgi:hypothetical protein
MGDALTRIALESQYLLKAYETYRQGFRENLDSFYAGLNALSLLTITLELAKKLPDVWGNHFDTDAEAKAELSRLELESQKLVGFCFGDARGMSTNNSS